MHDEDQRRIVAPAPRADELAHVPCPAHRRTVGEERAPSLDEDRRFYFHEQRAAATTHQEIDAAPSQRNLPLDHFCLFQTLEAPARRCKMYNLTCQGRYEAHPDVALAGQGERKSSPPARRGRRGQQQPRSPNQDPVEPPRVTRSDRYPPRADVGPEEEPVGPRNECGGNE
jgi:hypothetical protein